ncbi:4'-phosphopantetheinyl transferase superfamily protein [Catellatospora sp. NPDC049609]|uniref:holo-ACP synthase n=1 Tax=Catellatospora sp. NPDC049609 TaxID=3155505 RepID=UPI00342AE230
MAGSPRELIGLGHDLQLISELEVASGLREPDVFFTDRELRRFAGAVGPLQSLAGAFAAKEALFKALPPAREPWFWTEAELVHDRHGGPRFDMHGSLAGHLARHRLRVNVSISHSGGFVSSVVVVTTHSSAYQRFFGTIDRAVRHVLRRITTYAPRPAQ